MPELEQFVPSLFAGTETMLASSYVPKNIRVALIVPFLTDKVYLSQTESEEAQCLNTLI